MLILALSMPGGAPLSWVAAAIVVLGLIGLVLGTARRLRRRYQPGGNTSPEPGSVPTEVSSRG